MKFNFEKAKARYNNIMEDIACEHLTLDTPFSCKETIGWNIRDMVSEAAYQLSCYYEYGYCVAEYRYSSDEDERKYWRRNTGRLSRFIKAYEPFIEGVKCKMGHCSKYDN